MILFSNALTMLAMQGSMFKSRLVLALALVSLFRAAESTTAQCSNVNDASSSSTMSAEIQFGFTVPDPSTTAVNAWAVSDPSNANRRDERYDLTVTEVKSASFVAEIHRTDVNSGWSAPIQVCWTANDITQAVYSDGLTGKMTRSPVPPREGFFNSTVHDDTGYILIITGSVLYMSSVAAEIRQNRWKDAVTSPDEQLMTVNVTATSFIFDEPGIVVKGISAFYLEAMEIVGMEGNDVVFKPPDLCYQIDNTVCIKTQYPASDGTNAGDSGRSGTAGPDGLPGPEVLIVANDMEGSFNLTVQGSAGLSGQDGGSGHDGQPVASGSYPGPPGCTDWYTCGGANWYETVYKKGYKGYSGSRGGSGARAGNGGNGGDSGSITLLTSTDAYAQVAMGLTQAEATLTCLSGAPGAPGVPGRGSKGGNGGIGGCGSTCLRWPYGDYWLCFDDTDCNNRGPNGDAGAPGDDAVLVDAAPSEGDQGDVFQKCQFTYLDSLYEYYQNEEQLQRSTYRSSGCIIGRNNNTDAEQGIDFVLEYTTNDTSDMVEVASRWKTIIGQKFEYYGHPQTYAPQTNWKHWGRVNSDLLLYTNTLENTINYAQSSMQNTDTYASYVAPVAMNVIKVAEGALATSELDVANSKTEFLTNVVNMESPLTITLNEIGALAPSVISSPEYSGLIANQSLQAFVGGVVGFLGGVTGQPSDILYHAQQLIDAVGATCSAPVISSFNESMGERVDFGYAMEQINLENLDFDTVNSSAVNVIIDGNTKSSIDDIVDEISCLFTDASSSEAQALESMIQRFLLSGILRVNAVDRFLNMDFVNTTRRFQEDFFHDVTAVMQNGIDGVLTDDEKIWFSDYTQNVYQEAENLIMRSLFELANSYRSACLWSFNVLDDFTTYFQGDYLVEDGNLVDIKYLYSVRAEIDDIASIYSQLSHTSSGQTTEIYQLSWEFTEEDYPDMFSSLHTNGYFNMHIDLDETICDSHACDNTRLMAMYMDLQGDAQPATVPDEKVVLVAHQGDSDFLAPTYSGDKVVVSLQEVPQNRLDGRPLQFSSSRTASVDTTITEQQYRMCTNKDDIFQDVPCRSPFASYIVTVPVDGSQPCAVARSSTNCKDLDVTRFHSATFYAEVSAWPNYIPVKD